MDLLNAMRVFVRVVDRGSISHAARDLSTVQSAVSGRLDRLEKYLGVRLLHRTSRAMTCTDEGAEFYARSKIAIAAAEDACAFVDERRTTLAGSIRVAAPQCFGDVVLPALLSHIRDQHPELQLDITLNDRIVDPITEGVDLTFRLGSNLGDNLIAKPLGYIHRALVAAPSYLAANGAIRSPDDLASHPFIHVKGIFNGKLALKHRTKSTKPLVHAAITPSITSTHWRPMYELIASGKGIGVVQTPGCADALRDGRLVQVLPEFKVPKFELTALIPPSRPLQAKVRETLALTLQHLPKIPGFVPHGAASLEAIP